MALRLLAVSKLCSQRLMATCDVWDGFQVYTQNFAREVYSKPSPPTPFADAINKGVFDKEKGLTATVFRFANIEPTNDEPTWNPITLASGTGQASCGVTYTPYIGGFDAQTYQPVQFGMQGPILCRTDQYFNYSPAQWLDEYMVRLRKLSARQYDNFLTAQYIRSVPCSIAESNFQVGAINPTLSGLDQATSELTQDMLDLVGDYLVENGATEPDTNGWIMKLDGGLYWTLLISREMSRLLFLNNSEFREDLRQAYMGKEQGAPTMNKGEGRWAIKGFRHMIWLTPPRFTYSNGVYTRVNTFANISATKGLKPVFSDAWKGAAYEGCVVMSPHVFNSKFVKPSSAVDGMDWDPNEYGGGEWKFVTGIDAGCSNDPLRKQGRHFCEFDLALEPGALPESGQFIIYKRCPQSVATNSCS